MEQVILVDEQDNAIGIMEKMEAHEKALLHRAFSVFIMNSNGEMLLQQRALTKYHSAGLYTNACCSHPRPQEQTLQAAVRRTQEELGITINPKHIFSFTYKAVFDNGLTEHEYDHVFYAEYNEPINNFNADEVASATYLKLELLLIDIDANPTAYTEWFKIALPKFVNWYAG
jgi:isopentenyl-diphosphate Delta-isomerase